MLFLLSPAKLLRTAPAPDGVTWSPPRYLSEAVRLAAVLRGYAPQDLARLMKISDALSAVNAARWEEWTAEPDSPHSRPAVFLFDGNVYRGLEAATLPQRALAWAQEHLRILSGLYGYLRPLDAIQPHRLEMGTRIRLPWGGDLVAHWRGRIVEALRDELPGHSVPVVVNLASQEYFQAVDFHALDMTALGARVVECVFQEGKGGTFRVVGVHAKRARGLMARFAAMEEVTTPEGLQDFDSEGYRFDKKASTADRFVFRRTGR
ncbi:peroxide stress protein YaaA [Candidatus Symbiobacter mobilis]|uniref:UPF0246 protein Cenrod_0225 n=1 Tax=Candidatus Symbiobacter mobilis CR TaxID=946483 RepID=U5N7X5_9BURK|nr:peroxide stress protein YaaA [Candidatus Symbiobacter mobilis]AGX86353.1 hypothetical protein Cenrod_0225 [Candidatus Symbiobacter mobilis CR]